MMSVSFVSLDIIPVAEFLVFVVVSGILFYTGKYKKEVFVNAPTL